MGLFTKLFSHGHVGASTRLPADTATVTLTRPARPTEGRQTVRVEVTTAKGTVPFSADVDLTTDPFVLSVEPLAEVIRSTSYELIKEAGRSSRATQRNLRRSFAGYYGMLVAMFGVGLATFVASLVTVVQGREIATSAIFAGLSAVSFAGIFLTDPLKRMGEAGPQAAWAQAVVTTYWTKLAYMDDPRTVTADLNEAQSALAAALTPYFASVRSANASDDTPSNDPPSPTGAADAASSNGSPGPMSATEPVGQPRRRAGATSAKSRPKTETTTTTR